MMRLQFWTGSLWVLLFIAATGHGDQIVQEASVVAFLGKQTDDTTFDQFNPMGGAFRLDSAELVVNTALAGEIVTVGNGLSGKFRSEFDVSYVVGEDLIGRTSNSLFEEFFDDGAPVSIIFWDEEQTRVFFEGPSLQPWIGNGQAAITSASSLTAVLLPPGSAVLGAIGGLIEYRLVYSFSSVPGPDFNDDGALDCSDVDQLVAEIASNVHNIDFDLTGDGLVNEADLHEWLVLGGAVNLPSGGAYLVGDTNLDGDVDGADFIIWNANKFTATAAWCHGDFTADGRVDGRDFLLWNENKFTSAGTVAIPEPCGLTLTLVCLAIGRRRLAALACRR